MWPYLLVCLFVGDSHSTDKNSNTLFKYIYIYISQLELQKWFVIISQSVFSFAKITKSEDFIMSSDISHWIHFTFSLLCTLSLSTIDWLLIFISHNDFRSNFKTKLRPNEVQPLKKILPSLAKL